MTLAPGGWSVGEAAGPPFHPGRSARILITGRDVGVVGELHPSVTARLDLPRRVAVFELDVSALPEPRRYLEYRDVSRFPPVRRDLSIVLDVSVPAQDVIEAIVDASEGLVESPVLFDVYEDDERLPGRKSLAFSLEFRRPDRTLTGEEVDGAIRRITERLLDLGGELRSG